MMCGHMQGRFFAWLMDWLKPKRVLEVGTFTGYSALCFAERLPHEGEVHTIEIDDERERLIRENFELSGLIHATDGKQVLHLYMGDAAQVIPTLEEEWNLVLLDARKDDYPAHFELVVERLAPGGLVLFDNVLWNGQVIDPENHRPTTQLLRTWTLDLAQNPSYETLTLPMSDGLMLVRKREL